MLLSARDQNQQAMEVTNHLLEISRKERIYLRIIGADLLKIELLLKAQSLNKRMIRDLYHEAIHYGNEYEILNEFFIYRKEIDRLIKEMGNELMENFDTEERHFHQKILRLLELDEVTILSHREMDVLNELALGLTNKEISAKLYISVATTKTHILNIYRKLEVNSRVQAIEEARRIGILD
ncbi:response regulator transcription factor [Enterococcus sp. 669A]|uniref:Response regulator transcription factor n=2 Tax=Candidatus Enterococcus moelleringii TaxID=2815325 RepID=A0ABS3L7H9_9ENTE|nr:response regulator transcription factor [Enterococcus sp. 669A]